MAGNMDRQAAAYEATDENDEYGADPEAETSVKFIFIGTGDRHSAASC
jgi:hypothetical protein